MNLRAIEKDFITAADFANAFGIGEGFAKVLLDNSVLFWTLKKYYVFRCPDCGKELIRASSVKELKGLIVYCDGPHETGNLELKVLHKDISIVYGK